MFVYQRVYLLFYNLFLNVKPGVWIDIGQNDLFQAGLGPITAAPTSNLQELIGCASEALKVISDSCLAEISCGLTGVTHQCVFLCVYMCYMCVCMTRIYIYIYIYMCVCVYVYMTLYHM